MKAKPAYPTLLIALYFLGAGLVSAQNLTGANQDTDTVIIGTNPLRYTDQGFNDAEGQIDGARLWFMAQMRSDSLYQYIFARQEIHTAGGEPSHILKIFLRKDGTILSEIEFPIDARFMDPGGLNVLKNAPIDGIDRTLTFGMGRPACGYGYYSVLFFRKSDQLIPGVFRMSEGEAESPYEEFEFVAPTPAAHNQIWIEHRTGAFDGIKAQDFFTEYQKYIFENDSLVRLDPLSEHYRYVTAKTGLKLRNTPILEKSESTVAAVLPYGTRVKVRFKTDLAYTVIKNGEPIHGYWLGVENDGSDDFYFSGYVFSGFTGTTMPQD